MQTSSQGETKYSISPSTGWTNYLVIFPLVQGQLTLHPMKMSSVSIVHVSLNKNWATPQNTGTLRWTRYALKLKRFVFVKQVEFAL